MHQTALESYRQNRYDVPMFRLVIICILSMFILGCQLNRSFTPMSPRHFFGSEQSRQGIVALEQGHLSEAEKLLEDAVKWNKNDINHRRHYAEVLWQQGRHNDALQQLDEAVRRGGQNSASLHISIAEKRLELNEFQTAYQHADSAVNLEPQNYRSWALRGRAKKVEAHHAEHNEHTLAMLNEAHEDYLRAISLSPGHAGLLSELASIQMNCGQPEQALATWLTLQNLYPQGAEPMEVMLGKMETLTALNRLDEVEKIKMAVREQGMQ